jgi:hypothetical protein
METARWTSKTFEVRHIRLQSRSKDRTGLKAFRRLRQVHSKSDIVVSPMPIGTGYKTNCRYVYRMWSVCQLVYCRNIKEVETRCGRWCRRKRLSHVRRGFHAVSGNDPETTRYDRFTDYPISHRLASRIVVRTSAFSRFGDEASSSISCASGLSLRLQPHVCVRWESSVDSPSWHGIAEVISPSEACGRGVFYLRQSLFNVQEFGTR